MCRGRIQWWQSRTVSAAPVAGWTSSAGEGSTTSAGPFSQWRLCDCPTSGPGRWWCPGTWMTPLQSQCCSWWWVGGEQGGGLLKSTIISTVLSVLSSRLLRLHQTASSLTSCNLLNLHTPVSGVWWAHWRCCPVDAVASSKWMLHTGGGWGETPSWL